VTDAEVRNGCSVPTSGDVVAYEQMGGAVYECGDGRVLFWNDAGWGYVGEPMTEHAVGGEKVARQSDREACPTARE